MVFADLHNDNIVVMSEYHEKDLIKQIPGSKFDSKIKVWTLPVSWASCVQLRGVFQHDLQVGSALTNWSLREYAHRIYPSLISNKALELIDNGSVGAETIKFWREQSSKSLYPYQEAGVQFMARAGSALIADEMGPQPVNTSILTPSGWTTLGNLTCGDIVYSSDGNEIKITELKKFGLQPVYKVTLSDRTSTYATAEHRWHVYTPNDKHRKTNGRVLTTKQLLDSGLFNESTGIKNYKYSVPKQPILNFTNNLSIDLKLDPYAYGVLLGDAYITNKTAELSNPEDYILSRVELECHRHGTETTRTNYEGKCPSLRVSRTGKMLDLLEELGANHKAQDKYVHTSYLMSDEDTRREILAGLLDTDGSVGSAGAVEFSSASSKLAGHVAFLARSLGAVAVEEGGKSAGYKNKDGVYVSCLDRYRVWIYFPAHGPNPLRVPSKANKWENFTQHIQRKIPSRRIVSIEYSHETEVGCIGVDSEDHLYLTDTALIPTHNTGKTPTSLSAIRLFHEMFKTGLPAIVICPNSTKSNWAREAETWFKECHPYIVAGGAVQKRKILKEAQADPFALVIANFESIRTYSRLTGFGNIRLKKCFDCDPTVYSDEEEEQFRAKKPAACEVHHKELNNFGFKTAIVDEIHRIKDPKAKQTRAIWAVLHDKSVQRRWGLSGTPISKHIGDLWSIMYALVPEEAKTKSKFLERYAIQQFNHFGGMEILGLRPENKDEMFQFIDPRMRRVTKDVVLPWLPSKVYQQHVVEMAPKQKKVYGEIAEGLFSKLDDGSTLLAPKNVIAQTRLLQLSSSYCMVDKPDPGDPETWVVTPCDPAPKLDTMIELIHDRRGKPVVVAAMHKKLIQLAENRLEKEGIPYVTIHGDVSEAQRTLNLSLFEQGKVPVLMFTYAVGGVGLNMTAADTMIRLQIAWSMIDNLQGVDRLHRPGAEKHQSITIIDITTQGTVEENQRSRLMEKIDRLEQITRDRERRLERGITTDDLDQEAQTIINSNLAEV